MMASPCKNICRMHEPTGWCEGCARTIDEIAAWPRLGDDARRAVWALLPARQEALQQGFERARAAAPQDPGNHGSPR